MHQLFRPLLALCGAGLLSYAIFARPKQPTQENEHEQKNENERIAPSGNSDGRLTGDTANAPALELVGNSAERAGNSDGHTSRGEPNSTESET